MSKLIIPAAELIGTPLTTEELKSIMGGVIMAGNCFCSYTRTGPLFEGAPAKHSTTMQTQTSADCETACKQECDNDNTYKCQALDWNYKEEANGSWHA